MARRNWVKGLPPLFIKGGELPKKIWRIMFNAICWQLRSNRCWLSATRVRLSPKETKKRLACVVNYATPFVLFFVRGFGNACRVREIAAASACCKFINGLFETNWPSRGHTVGVSILSKLSHSIFTRGENNRFDIEPFSYSRNAVETVTMLFVII